MRTVLVILVLGALFLIVRQPAPHRVAANTNSTAPTAPARAGAVGLPLMLDYRNYDLTFGPAFVYAWYTERAIERGGMGILSPQLNGLAAMPNAGLTKMLMVSSVARLDHVLREEGEALRRSGIAVIGYNTENAVGTPAGEMAALGDSTPANLVARAAALAEAAGLQLIWGPIRDTADRVPDSAIAAMVTAGLDGLALQEQKGIESQPVEQRVQAVERTAARYRALGGAGFHVSVQIMPTRCPNTAAGRWAVCADFVSRIAGSVDSVAIWASDAADRAALPQLVQALAGE